MSQTRDEREPGTTGDDAPTRLQGAVDPEATQVFHPNGEGDTAGRPGGAVDWHVGEWHTSGPLPATGTPLPTTSTEPATTTDEPATGTTEPVAGHEQVVALPIPTPPQQEGPQQDGHPGESAQHLEPQPFAPVQDAENSPGVAPDDDARWLEEAPSDLPVPEPLDPMSDTLHPAMALHTPTGSFTGFPVPEVVAGQTFAGRYRLEQQLAQRGGTLTWRAFDQKLSRSVLVHIMAQDDPRTSDVLEAARKAAFATDSRFLRVLDAVPGEEPGEPALVVCEFAPGESLEKLLEQGPLSALEAAWVARELADALAAMHAEGLFHQRINPDTVIITATGNVKIVGFLIEAAMYPDAEDGTLAWSEREHADVLALGKVLYASLVTRWPTPREHVLDPGGEPRRTWGLLPAPMDGRGWLTPRQIRSGVSPALDVICDQILSEAPRHNEMPLRTANQVMLALTKVLGTADAAQDLERRMRYPVVPVGQDSETRRAATNAAVHGRGRGDVDSMADTATFNAVHDEHTVQPFAGLDDAAAASGDARSQGQGRAQDPARPANQGGAADHGGVRMPPSGTRVPSANRPPRRRWLAILAALFVLLLLAGLVRVALHQGSSSSGSPAAEPTALTPLSATAFDPTADGGNADENSADAKLAIDGKPATAWTTVTYLGNPKLGGLKPGVGLVVDMGRQVQVGSVTLTLQGGATTVQLRVPADAADTTAPTTSQKQWTTVATGTSSGTSLVLQPEQAVSTRYLLVYLTSLPQVSSNHYRGAVAEVAVKS